MGKGLLVLLDGVEAAGVRDSIAVWRRNSNTSRGNSSDAGISSRHYRPLKVKGFGLWKEGSAKMLPQE